MSINNRDFDYIRKLVRDRSAIVLEKGKEYLVESRLNAVVRQHEHKSLESFIEELRTKPFGELHRRAVEAMTTNETTFFRDIHPFEALRQSVLPDLIARRAKERQLNIWSAACSSGQEAYSIAMLLREHFPQLATWRVRIIASDLSAEMLARTRAGRYNQTEVNRGLPPPLLTKYFRRQGVEWEITNDLRQMIELHEMNLADSWPTLPAMDIIFIRNVLIYFDVEVKKTILGKTRQLLRADGYLFLGGAETTLNLDDAFDRADFDKAGCYRLRERAAMSI